MPARAGLGWEEEEEGGGGGRSCIADGAAGFWGGAVGRPRGAAGTGARARKGAWAARGTGARGAAASPQEGGAAGAAGRGEASAGGRGAAPGRPQLGGGGICPSSGEVRGATAERCGEGAQQRGGAGLGSCGRPRSRALTCAVHLVVSSPLGSVEPGPCPVPGSSVGRSLGCPGWVGESGVGLLWKSVRTVCTAALRRRSGVRLGKLLGIFYSCYAEFNSLGSGCLAAVVLLAGRGGGVGWVAKRKSRT